MHFFAPAGKSSGPRPRPTRSLRPNLEWLEGRCLLSNVDVSNISGYQGETAIAINPTNPQNMIIGSNDLSGLSGGFTRAYFTTNGGTTWTGVGLGNSGDPGVAFDRHGNAYFSYITSANGIGVSKSTNGGQTWGATVTVSGRRNSGVQDKPEITVGPDHSNTANDRIYVAWDNNSAGDVLKVVSSTNGTKWSSPVSVDGQPNEIFAEPAVGSDGTLYVAWIDFGTANIARLKVSSSTNDGSSFSTPVVAATSAVNPFVPSNYDIPAQPTRGIGAAPSLAIDRTGGAHNGRLYLTYTDAAAGNHNDTNVMLTHSDDGGRTWSTPVKVNDDATTNSQFFSWVAVDPTNGSVNLAWYDARNDPNNQKVDVYFTRSTDGGVTFAPNTQVTDVQSDESNTATDNANQYGDYMGLAAYGGKAFPVWCDTRNGVGNEEIYTVAAGGLTPVPSGAAAISLRAAVEPETSPSAAIPAPVVPDRGGNLSPAAAAGSNTEGVDQLMASQAEQGRLLWRGWQDVSQHPHAGVLAASDPLFPTDPLAG
jgi:hypothetical protein